MMRGVTMVLLLPMLVWAGSECKARCGLTSISITVESDECSSCITINTTACAGFCHTQDRVYHSLLAPYFQKICNFRDWMYETIQLPGCAPGVDSSFTYPVALSCECSRCNTEIADCGAFSMHPNSCHTHAKPLLL